MYRTMAVGMNVTIALLAVLILLGGCSSDDGFTSRDARRNLSPAMDSMGLTKEQRKNRTAYTFDVNLRQLNDDVDMILLLDRPTYLTRSPMP